MGVEQVPAVVAGRYRLRDVVGAGGMGTVWRAADEVLGREVAVKRVRLDGLPPAEAALARERTMREARIAAALHHPHIVSIFDVVLEDGEPWLILEYLPSRSLGSILDEYRTLPPTDVAAIGAQVAAALTAAHEVGVVHRDVKPDNILVAHRPMPGSTGPLVKLTDFGISHAATAPAITATEVLTGTPAYFAPETARRGHRSAHRRVLPRCLPVRRGRGPSTVRHRPRQRPRTADEHQPRPGPATAGRRTSHRSPAPPHRRRPGSPPHGGAGPLRAAARGEFAGSPASAPRHRGPRPHQASTSSRQVGRSPRCAGPGHGRGHRRARGAGWGHGTGAATDVGAPGCRAARSGDR
jgi:tRNA A-37 threonylcarbamoyl transferase component Bud32